MSVLISLVPANYANKPRTAISSITTGFIIVALMLVNTVSIAQDTTQIQIAHRVHCPERATWYALALPGLGQAYNRKFWKIPIVYAGFAGLGYNAHINRIEFLKFREAFQHVLNQDTIPINNPYIDRYNLQQLRQGMDFYRRNMEFGYILTGFWYILTVLDAVVDAHLFDYDISEELSLRASPVMLPNLASRRYISGMTLTLRF
ncbi:MAG TPA: DUF5683 domain-containing protein [Bacteroidales bacterium]|nr:DUF5683 domain-containing protein [Bacteroidales bacterium]